MHTLDSKPDKQEVNGTVILPPLVFPAISHFYRLHYQNQFRTVKKLLRAVNSNLKLHSFYETRIVRRLVTKASQRSSLLRNLTLEVHLRP